MHIFCICKIKITFFAKKVKLFFAFAKKSTFILHFFVFLHRNRIIHIKIIKKMAETKGRKIYTLLSITDVEIIGLWSNLSSLIRDFNNGSTLLSYYKIYRLIKTHEENETIDIFEFNFTSVDGKKYKIKIKNLQ